MKSTSVSDPHAPLGARIELFRPMMANLIAWGIFSFLLFGGGLAILGSILREVYLAGGNLPAAAKEGMSWLVVGAGSGLGVGLVVSGVCFACFFRWLTSHEVELCENGFRYREGKNCEEVAWTAITSIRETVLYERPPLLKGPAKLLLPKLANKSYTVITKNGKEFAFTEESIKRLKHFEKLLRERAAVAGVPWETVERHA
jgi:hypothetical protein